MVGEVQFEFHECRDVEQFVAQFAEHGAVVAAHLVHGHAVVGRGGRGDEVGHGFGLAEVHFPVEESPLRELPGACRFAALRQEQFHHAVEDVARTVAGNLRTVLARIGVGCAKQADQHLVDRFPVLRVHDASERERPAPLFRERLAPHSLENGSRSLDGLRPRHTNDAQCPSRGSGHGTDC